MARNLKSIFRTVKANGGRSESEMGAQTITFNEVEWRSAEVTARSGKIFSTAAHHARLGIRHLGILHSLGDLSEAMKGLLAYLHEEEPRKVLEMASQDQRQGLAEKLRDSHDKVQMMLARLRSTDHGHWERYYRRKYAVIEGPNLELCALSDALKNYECEVIMLSKRDQDYLLQALMNPKEPSEDLRGVFARK